MKEDLFRAILERCIARFADKQETWLFRDDKSILQALNDYLSAAIFNGLYHRFRHNSYGGNVFTLYGL